MGRPIGSKNRKRPKIKTVVDYYECDYCHRRMTPIEIASAKFDRCICNRRLDAFRVVMKYSETSPRQSSLKEGVSDEK